MSQILGGGGLMAESIHNKGVRWVDKVHRKSISLKEPLEIGERYLLTVNSGEVLDLDIYIEGNLVGTLKNNRLSFVSESETDTLVLRYWESVDPTNWRITLERRLSAPSGLDYAKEYQLTKALDPEQRYMITVEATSVDRLGVWLGRDYFAGYIGEEGLLMSDFGKAYDSIVIKSSSKYTIIDKVMLTRGVKFVDWLPTPEDTDNRFSLIKQTVDEIVHRVGDNEDNVSEVIQTAEEISTQVSNNRDDIANVSIKADEISAQVSNNRDDIAEVSVKADGVRAQVTNNKKDIAEVSIKADGIAAQVSSNTGNLAKVRMDADSISTQVSNNTDGISHFRQTANNISLGLRDLKDNPISGINFSQEGVSIHGDRIDLEGLVTVWNADGTPGTQIDGDRIITGSLDADRIGAGLIEGNTIKTNISEDAMNYIHMREQMLTFHAGKWEKMQIGFKTIYKNEEPYIRMGVGDHIGNDIFHIEKNTGYTDMFYRSMQGLSRLKMKINGDVEFRAARTILISGTMKTNDSEIIDASDASSPRIRIPTRGELRIGSNRDVVRIRDDISGSSRSLELPGLHGFVTGEDSNMNVSGAMHVRRVSSARKYKRDIEPIGLKYAEDFFYNAEPVWYRSRGADNPNHSFYGYIADDVAKIDPRLVHFTSYGEVEGLSYGRVPALLHTVMLKQEKRINELEDKVDAIFNKLKNS